MKELIRAFPYWIDHFPGIGALTYNKSTFMMLALLYLGIWAIVARTLYIPKMNGRPMLEGFIISLVVTIMYYYWHSLPYTLSFDKPNKKLVISRTQSGGGRDYKVLYKSPWTDKKKTHFKSIKKEKEYYRKGFVIDAEKYKKYKQEGKIDDATLADLSTLSNDNVPTAGAAWRRDLEARNLEHTNKVNYNTPFEEMVSVSFYLLIVLYSAAIIIAKANKKIFRLLFPWIILSTLFLLIQSAVWIQNPNAQKSALTFVIKRQLFILGLSFSLTGILIVLKLNNR
jgi:hypothetical protein